MAVQVNFFCFLMFLFCLACNMVPENWHICVNKGVTYLRYVQDSSSRISIDAIWFTVQTAELNYLVDNSRFASEMRARNPS